MEPYLQFQDDNNSEVLGYLYKAELHLEDLFYSGYIPNNMKSLKTKTKLSASKFGEIVLTC